MQSADSPDEKDMDRYLKAHDDLQTVLRLYEGVLDGKTTLPLNRSATGLAGVSGGGDGDEGVELGFGAFEGGAGRGVGATGDESSDDDSLNNGRVGRKKADPGRGGKQRGVGGPRPRTASGGGESSGRASPTKGNLLDLEENAPLDMGAADGGGGMMVAYTGGRFEANTNYNGPGGGSVTGAAGYDRTSSASFGSGTASNIPSETGAMYGSNTFNSSNNGSAFSGQAARGQTGGGDGGAGFGERCHI